MSSSYLGNQRVSRWMQRCSKPKKCRTMGGKAWKGILPAAWLEYSRVPLSFPDFPVTSLALLGFPSSNKHLRYSAHWEKTLSLICRALGSWLDSLLLWGNSSQRGSFVEQNKELTLFPPPLNSDRLGAYALQVLGGYSSSFQGKVFRVHPI